MPPPCQHCGGPMTKASKREVAWGGCAVTLLGLILGVILLVIFWPLGLVTILLFLFVGLIASDKKIKLWRCPRCRVAMPRY